jgi:hypothetical protein
MAGYSTALVTVGAHSVGPFGSRHWRAQHCVTLIEKHRSAWMTDAIGFSGAASVPRNALYLPESMRPAAALAVVIAGTVVCREEFLDYLDSRGLVTTEGLDDFAVDRWMELPQDADPEFLARQDEMVTEAMRSIRDVARIGITRLEEMCALDDEEVVWLRGQGLDVDEFTLRPVPSPVGRGQ